MLNNPDGTLSLTFIKINERQYIELFPERTPATDRLNHISIETDDIEGMRLYLASQGVKVPDGFAITAEAYRYFLREDSLDKRIDDLLKGLDTRDIDALRRCGSAIREEILATALPTNLETEILAAYDQLRVSSQTFDVAVRSSATAEDLPDASFAGAQQTFLNVEG